MTEYKEIAKKTVWEDCALSFICDCGENIYLDTQNEPEECPNCKRVYSLVSYVQEIIKE